MVEQLRENTNLKTGFAGTKFALEDKFNFLTKCSQEFQHTVPNSVLHEIETLSNCFLIHPHKSWSWAERYKKTFVFFLDDVIDFYETAINTFLPLDELSTRELPPNLHIEHKYTRFHPDTDTMFGGKTAFPESSTIVTGLKYRKKYPGFVAEKTIGIDEDPE